MEHDQEADVFALELNDGPNKKVLLSSCRDDEQSSFPSSRVPSGTTGSATGIKIPGDRNKKDSFSAVAGFRAGRVCCCFPLTLELTFLAEEKWSVFANHLFLKNKNNIFKLSNMSICHMWIHCEMIATMKLYTHLSLPIVGFFFGGEKTCKFGAQNTLLTTAITLYCTSCWYIMLQISRTYSSYS